MAHMEVPLVARGESWHDEASPVGSTGPRHRGGDRSQPWAVPVWRRCWDLRIGLLGRSIGWISVAMCSGPEVQRGCPPLRTQRSQSGSGRGFGDEPVRCCARSAAISAHRLTPRPSWSGRAGCRLAIRSDDVEWLTQGVEEFVTMCADNWL